MQRVAGMEHMFLGIDSDEFPMDGAAILVLDPSTGGAGFGYDGVRAAFERGLHRAPILTRRVVQAPSPTPGYWSAYWVDDPDFDLDAHLDRATVPAPGDRAALAELAVTLSEGRLPRDRPLWRAWYVDGLAGGEAAVIIRLHHAAVDGVAGMELFGALLDSEPITHRPGTATSAQRTTAGRLPSAPELALRSVRDVALMPLNSVREAASLAAGLVAGGIAAGGPPSLAGPGPSLFNRAVEEPGKSLALLELPLAEVKAIKDALGVSLTDLVLATVTASLRAYLLGRGESLEGPLSSLCPINLRGAQEPTGAEPNGAGNNWAMMFVDLPVHLDGPREQLRAINEATAKSKRVTRARAAFVNPSEAVAGMLPPVVWPLVGKLGERLPALADLQVSSIPGSSRPLYLGGAQLRHIHSRTFTQAGAGFFIACIGYCDTLDIGITATRELVPDPELISAGMADALAVLRSLAPVAAR